MNYILVVFLRDLLQDLPLLITSFFCLWVAFYIYLPEVKRSRKWVSLIFIEFAEHILLPVSLFIILLLFNNYLAGFFFNLVILTFIFLILGYFILKVRDRESWKRVCIISLFVYGFIYLYPFLLISIQMNSGISGWWIMGITNLLFFIFFIFSFYRKRSRLSREQKLQI